MGRSTVIVDTSKHKEPATPPPPPNGSAPVNLDIKTMLVTPQQAKAWLGENSEDNRTQRKKRIESYARDMRAGRWKLTGEAIKIDVDGKLIDGQHRLEAVVLADVSVYMVVITNLPHDVMAALDSGISRTFGDKLKGVSQTHRNQIAAVVRKIVAWDAGNRTGGGGAAPTHGELMAAFNADPAGYTAATMHGIDVSRQKLCGPVAAATAFYLFARLNPEDALQFFDQLKTGANLPDASPILAVRNRFSRMRFARREDKITPEEQLALLIRAWNAFREKRTLGKIPIVKGTLTNKNFPIPV